MIRIEECFIEPKSWEAPGLQRIVPWNLKVELYVSPLSYSLCTCFIPSLQINFLSSFGDM